jgi:hypothetical protein
LKNEDWVSTLASDPLAALALIFEMPFYKKEVGLCAMTVKHFMIG